MESPSPPFPDLLTGPTPSILVFDCDWTLYPYDCDKDCVSPFERTSHGVVDFWGRWADPYPHVPSIFGAIIDAEIPVAFLSRNPSADAVRNLLQTISVQSKRLGTVSLWDSIPTPDYFHAYSSNGYGKGKDRHFAALKSSTGIPYRNLLFFDDLKDNIDAAAAQGTTSVLLGKSGLTWAAFADGIRGWRGRIEKIEGVQPAAEQHPPTAQNGSA